MDPWADEGEPPTVVELNSVDDPFIMPPDSALKCSPKVTDEPVVTSSGNMANVRNNENKRNSGDGFVNRISQVAEIIHYEIECCDNVEANGQAVQRTNGYICSLPEEEKSLGSNAASIDTHGSEEDLIGASLSPTIDRPESCSALEGPEGNTAPGGTAAQQESSKGGPTLRAPFACDAGGRQARTPPAVPAKPRRAAPPLAPPPPPPTDSAAPADEGDATEQTAPLPPRTRPSPPPPPPSSDKIAGCDVTPEETDASEDAEERLERANEDDEDDSGVVSGDEDSAAMDTARRARSGRPSTKPVIVEEHRKAAFLDVAPNGVANGVAEGAAECHVVFARRPQSPCQDCVEADADVSRPTPPGAALAGQTSEAVGAERPPCPADSALTPFAAGRGNAPEQEVHVAKVPGERTGSEANGRPLDGMEGDIFARVWNAVAEEEVAAAREGLVNGAGGAAEAAAREEGEAAALGDALHAAVARRDAALAGQLLRRGTSPDAPDWRASGEPPLLRAAANGDLACVRLLLAAGCAANARSALGETALHLAARGARGEGGAALLHALLQGGCDARLQCSLQGCSPLHVLCRRGPAPQDLPALEVLARASGAVDLRDHRSRTALHRLVEAGAPHTALYETLLRAGADASLQDARGETPLLAALQRSGGSGGGGPMAHVVALLAPRTDLARATAYGETALHLAARTDRPDLVRVLLQHGAPLDARDLRGNTALHLAAGRGFVRVAALLLAAAPAAAANAANADGCTPLHVAVDSGFVPVVQLLLEIEQCDLQARTHLGQTPLDLAQEEYRRRSTPQMALILLQAINKRQEVCTM